MGKCSCEEVVVIDFETTGISPVYNRIIEVGAVIVKAGKVIDSFSELMNPGCRVPYEITALTGINNDMLKGKPTPEEIMPKLKKFVGNRVMLAHNASFDRKFLYAEMERVNLKMVNPVLCSLLLSRRLIPGVYNYKLGTIAKHLNINIVNAHRALDDVIATAKIWEHLYKTVSASTGIQNLDDHIFSSISKQPKKKVEAYLIKVREATCGN